VKLVKCITQDIEVPEDADIVIEGYIDPHEEYIWEGPFGDHTGFYSLADWFPKLHVTCITQKKGAVYPATIVGQPPMEDAWIARATERIFLTPLKMAISQEIIDMHLPFEGVAHNIVILKIAQSFQGQGTRVMHAMWGAGQMAFNKILIIVSDEIDITDYMPLCKTISKNLDIKKDIHLSEGVLDELDHASGISCYGGKICFDATNHADKLFFDKQKIREWKKTIINQENSIRDINIDLIDEDIAFAVIAIHKNENISGLIKNILSKSSNIGLKLLIFVESTVDIFDYSQLAWIVSANINPKNDCIVDHDAGILTIDATRKIFKGDYFNRKWPNIVHMDQETILKINEKWSFLGIGDLLESPSIRLMKLNNNQGDIAITD
jgi:4-hydroxy-3-polyprenylbenzoate decarboxylase